MQKSFSAATFILNMHVHVKEDKQIRVPSATLPPGFGQQGKGRMQVPQVGTWI